MSIKLSPDMMQKMHNIPDYDSDKMEDYWPPEPAELLEYEPIVLSQPKEPVKAPKRKIRSKPSKGGFRISAHGVRK